MALLLYLIAGSSHAGSFAFEDIAHWTGSGESRAAVAIDWDGDDNSDTALVWGYRWDGVATGEQMLRAVLAADERLFAKLSAPGPFGIATYGFGYDENNDGLFALDDGTSFEANGVAESGPSDGAEAVDPLDRYREGWADGYWHYGIGASGDDGPVWSTAAVGPTGRELTDGEWNSYAFAVTINFDEFAENLVAAAGAVLEGDFNADGAVDAADFTVWRDTLGDASSYALWRDNFGATTAGADPITIPEPATAALVLLSSAALAWPARTTGPLT